jgi:hypothetical protein
MGVGLGVRGSVWLVGGWGVWEWVSRGEKPVLSGGDVLAVEGLVKDKFLGFFWFADGFVSLDYFVGLILGLL